MIYRAFLGKEEVNEFNLDGQEIDEIRGGKEIFWRRGGIRVKENIANFCGFSKCVSENGAELLAVCHKRTPIDVSEGTFLELFTGNSPYSKRLIECKMGSDYAEGENWKAISCGKYFYVIKYACTNYAAGEYVVTSFYKFDESGNTIYHFENSEIVPTDGLKGITIHKHSHYLHGLRDFYVINDVFYIIFKIESTEVTHEDDTGLFFIIGYQNGIHMSQRLVLDAETDTLINPSPCTYQFMVNNSAILTGVNVGGAYYDNRPLENVSDDSLKAITSQNYSFLGTDGKKIYLTDVGENSSRRRNIYLYEDGKCVLKKNMDDDKNYMNHQFLTATFVDDMMYAVMIYGNNGFPSSAIVVEIDTKTFGKSRVIYKLNTSVKKYAWAAIRQITSKNGKIYVHKEYQKSWTDEMSELGIDEITLDNKKKGETT